jgi:TrmH family RNA methyltransferase
LKALSWYKALSDGRGRRESGFFIVEGRRAVEQITTVASHSVEELLVIDMLRDEYKHHPWPVRALKERQFRNLCASKTPQGVAAVVKIPEGSYGGALPAEPGEMLLLLEGVQDPGNVGTLIRTAAAFDFKGVVLSASCADPFSPKAVQASAGSIMSLWIRRTDRYLDIAKELKNRGCKLIAADLRGAPLTPAENFPRPYVLMLGSEGAGLNDEILTLADRKVRIPIHTAKAESLNVAAAGAVFMFCSGADADIRMH